MINTPTGLSPMRPARADMVIREPTFSGPVAIFSGGIRRIPGIETLLGVPVVRGHRFLDPRRVAAVAAWGRRPTSLFARRWSERHGKPFIALEDGFLRSVGPGGREAPLSIVVDDLGIYYDASQPSRLDMLCAYAPNADERARALHLIDAWRAGRVSKYNYLREDNNNLPEDFVLVADQTRGDASLAWGQVDEHTFERMVWAALQENPSSLVLVKTHPDVRAGKAKGCIDPTLFAGEPRVRWLAENLHPVGLLERARAVYVATSQMGFEALLWGRPVRCFGMPFYAGRGLTLDALPAPPWRTPIDLPQLVHASLIRYPRYLDPGSGELCAVERVLEHLSLQRRLRSEFPSAVEAVGFSAWKRPLLRQFLQGSEVVFRSRRQEVPSERALVLWGAASAGAHAGPVLRLEDGFLRSVGLGASLARPLSWVVDDVGIYYDAGRASALERLLSRREIEPALLERAKRLRERIVDVGLGKYNLPGAQWQRRPETTRVVLVVGQVESDAAVALGAGTVRDNAALLAAARARCPDAWILYKPHPDVVSGLRRKGSRESMAMDAADEVVSAVSMPALLDAVDEVHVISSLAGFEALLRGVRVVCHGVPFYAGWGLTEDLAPPLRRERRLSLDELVAGALILYPRYVHPDGGYFMTPEEAIEVLIALRGNPRIPLWRRLMLPLLRLRAR